MNRGARLALSICTIAGLFSSAGVANAQQNLYMDVAYQCYPTALTQYVWLIPDNFIADGWTGTEVNQLEGTIIRAINVWNEETNSQRRIIYAGRGYPKNRPVSPEDTFVTGEIGFRCTSSGFTAYGRAEGTSAGTAGSSCATPRTLYLYLRTCPNGAPMVEVPYTFYWPIGSEVSMEAVLIHEFGHALFGFDDQAAPAATPRGVMWGTLYSGPQGERLHLYRADQDTAIFGAISGEGSGASTGRTVAWKINSSNSWVGATPGFLSSPTTTFGPSLATRHSNYGYYGSALMLRSTRGAGYTFDVGDPAGWSNLGGINNYYLTSAQIGHSWAGAAYSRYDEVMGAWMECDQLQPDFGLPTHCQIDTGFKPIYQSGSSWQENVLTEPPIARPEVAYDAWTDRFVMVFIHRDGRLWHAFTPAAYVAWSTPALLGTTDGVTRHFRYLGGTVFDYTPPPGHPGAPTGRYGWVFAATADYRADGVLTPIMQVPLQYNPIAGQYVLGVPDLPVPGASALTFDTVRAFDVGESVDSNTQLLAFLRPTLSPWQQRLVVARRTSASGPFGTPVQMPWYHSGVISGSVAVSSMADSSGEFVIGVGGEP
jgi:hypothetical protein